MPPQPPKKGSGAVIVTLSLVAVAVLGIVGIIALVGLNVGDKNKPVPKAAPPPLTELPIKPGSAPAPAYGGVSAPNACTLVPVDFLLSRGWVLSREAQIFDRLPDPDAPTAQAVQQQPGGVVAGISGCAVPFDNRGNATLNIRSAPLDDARILASKADSARDDSEVYRENGVEVLVDNDPENNRDRPSGVYGYLVKGSMLAEFNLSSPDGTPRDRALDTAKQAISRITGAWDSASKSPSVATYPQPYGNVPDPCKTISAEDLTSLFGQPNSGMIEQREWTTSPVEVFKMDTGEQVEYVETRCSQGTLHPWGEPSRPFGSIGVNIQTYPDAAKAAGALRFFADPKSEIGRSLGPAKPLNTTIGDSPAYISTAFGSDRAIMFQVDRYLVAATASEGYGPFNEDALRTRLTPVARQMADSLR
ncbi:hypothetical protein AB0L88_38240 [Saccharopolyspora shandongensis]|uniref:hypothetical protein n=1 Tax=Saccharopolyspora shandongensis TaxID=418495 RepID=UPI0034395383